MNSICIENFVVLLMCLRREALEITVHDKSTGCFLWHMELNTQGHAEVSPWLCVWYMVKRKRIPLRRSFTVFVISRRTKTQQNASSFCLLRIIHIRCSNTFVLLCLLVDDVLKTLLDLCLTLRCACTKL